MGRASNAKQRLMDAVRELIWTGSYGSTTIDQICERAGVKKGSFYYFFESKADLAVAAIDADWQNRRKDLDAIFSPTVPPLKRIADYNAYGFQLQSELKCKCGCVLGCPLFTLGAEVSTQEKLLRAKVEEILDYKLRYLESAIRDAVAAGDIPHCDPSSKAKMLFAYYQGLLTQARIENDIDVLREGFRRTPEILGAKTQEAVSA